CYATTRYPHSFPTRRSSDLSFALGLPDFARRSCARAIRSGYLSHNTVISTPSIRHSRAIAPEPRLPNPITPMRTTSSFGAAYPLMLHSCLPSPRATPLARRSGVSPVNANEGNPVATAPVPNARLWMNFLRDFMTVIFYVLQGRKKPGDVLCEPRGSTAQRLQKPNLIHRAHVVMPLITRPIVHII